MWHYNKICPAKSLYTATTNSQHLNLSEISRTDFWEWLKVSLEGRTICWFYYSYILEYWIQFMFIFNYSLFSNKTFFIGSKHCNVIDMFQIFRYEPQKCRMIKIFAYSAPMYSNPYLHPLPFYFYYTSMNLFHNEHENLVMYNFQKN